MKGQLKPYNNEAICKAVGYTPKAVRETAERAGVTAPTVVKALEGEANIRFNVLLRIIKASGANYADVFNADTCGV